MNRENSSENNDIKFTLDNLFYSIRPINLQDPSHLRCIVSITNKNGYQSLDRLDLYNAGSRRLFIKKSIPRLEADACIIEKHLLEIVAKLETLRTHDSELPTIVEIPPMQKQEALEYLKSPDLIDTIIQDYKQCGYVGEEKNFLTGYIVSISRKLDKPLGMIIISRSGAGKSTLQQAIVSFIPPEDCLNYTRITNTAFYYQDRYALKHKLISIDEEKGLSGANYAVRSLLNGEGFLTSATTKDPLTGNMKAKNKTVEGPSSLLIGTTQTEMDHETLSRFLITTVDESQEQTKKILQKQKHQDTLQGITQSRLKQYILQKHHNIQRLLQPLVVINPVRDDVPSGVNNPDIQADRLITRRSQTQYHKLTKAIALLHQHQREIKTAKDEIGEYQYIEITQKDIDLADYISKDLIKRTYDELSPVTRQFLGELKNLTQKNQNKQFTRRDIRGFTKWNDYQIRQCLKELETMEYIMRRQGSQGKLCQYELIYEGEEQTLNSKSETLNTHGCCFANKLETQNSKSKTNTKTETNTEKQTDEKWIERIKTELLCETLR